MPAMMPKSAVIASHERMSRTCRATRLPSPASCSSERRRTAESESPQPVAVLSISEVREKRSASPTPAVPMSSAANLLRTTEMSRVMTCTLPNSPVYLRICL